MSKGVLEKIAAGVSVVVLVGWGIFWTMQVISVIELLALAYG